MTPDTADAAAPLFDAVKRGDAEGAHALAAADPGLLRARQPSGETPLLLAAYYRQAAVAERLLALDPPLDIWEAAALGRAARVAEWLDAEPALLNAHAPDGFWPLGLAAFFGHAEVAELLLARGADTGVVAANAFAVMALHAACAGRHTGIAAALLAHGAPVNAAQRDGYTPLHQAVAHGNRPLVELLLAHGADPAIAKADGQTARDLAEDTGNRDLLPLLG
ncbi:MAG TPA: ankyrin repeat domain-containing protein [Alphaproteobacteria bacterium]|nr:ankyrin repeat domain-containing protein [Alphaproteobacteria bacterium]